MSFVYNEAKRAFAAAEYDLDLPDDIRIVLVMTNTTADTQVDVNTLGGITTLDLYDGTGHDSVNGHALAGEVVNEDAPNNRAEFDATDLTITGLAAGIRQAQALLMFKWVTSIALSLPLAFIDTGGFPFDGNGGDVTFQWNVEGILQFT